MTLKKMFLPVGLLIAIAVALTLPAIGTALKVNGAVPWFIIIIFFVNGYQIRGGEVRLSRKLLFTLGFAVFLSLGMGPILGTALARLTALPAGLALGLVVMSSVPPTLSSGIVITEVSGGNTAWALLMTITLNALGVLIIPFTLQIFLATGANVTVEPLPLLKKLTMLVILPFVIGIGVKRLTRAWNPAAVLRFIPSTCVILTVLSSLSASRETLLATELKHVPLMILGAAGVHLLLLLLTIPGAKLLGLKDAEGKALMFVGSQKTLPIAISVLAALGGEAGPALIVCLLFHFQQLILDSFIAARVAKG